MPPPWCGDQGGGSLFSRSRGIRKTSPLERCRATRRSGARSARLLPLLGCDVEQLEPGHAQPDAGFLGQTGGVERLTVCARSQHAEELRDPLAILVADGLPLAASARPLKELFKHALLA